MAACEKGVIVAAYDGIIEEPCAYNTHVDQFDMGKVTAEWLAKKLNGKGNVVAASLGTTEHPSTRCATRLPVKCSRRSGYRCRSERHVEPGGRTDGTLQDRRDASLEMIDGLWMQAGCFTANSMQSEAGIPDDKIKPCAGEGENGTRIQMLPGLMKSRWPATYRPMGAPGMSASSQVYPGAYALKMAVEKLDGKNVEKPSFCRRARFQMKRSSSAKRAAGKR